MVAIAEHLVPAADEIRKPIVLIKASEYRRRRAISRAKEYSELASGLDVPRPIRQGGERYYIEAEVQAFLQRLIANARGGDGAVTCELPQPPAEPSPVSCLSCGVPLVRTGKRGRPQHRCDNCRNTRARSDSGHSRG